jgi:hypothetical protein
VGLHPRPEGLAMPTRCFAAATLSDVSLLRGALRREAPPLYWAGFICHGRDDALK